jgi:hypothetical protein
MNKAPQSLDERTSKDFPTALTFQNIFERREKHNIQRVSTKERRKEKHI